MNEHELRALVREAVDRHIGERGPESFSGGAPGSLEMSERTRPTYPEGSRPQFHLHASHLLLKVIPGSEVDDGMCVIEPAVRCNHCGFCQSYGH